MNTASRRRIICPHLMLLILLLGFFMFLDVLWIHLSRGPASWDDAWYLQDSLKMFDALMHRGPVGWLHYFIREAQEHFKAPLICALPTPIYLITGRNAHHALYLNIVFMALLLGDVYAIARKYFCPRIALLAVFITGSMPLLYGLATWFLVEYGLAAFTVLAIVCLIYSQDLRKTAWVALFSAICGLGLMQKIIFPVYLAPLAIYFFFRWMRRLSRDDAHEVSIPTTLATIIALLVPALVIAGPWYAFNWKDAVQRALFSGYDAQEAGIYGTGDPYTFAAMGKYLIKVINEGIGAPYFCVAIIVLAILAYLHFGRARLQAPTSDAAMDQSMNAPFWQVAILWLLPFLVFLLGRNKLSRFLAPILPIFALCLAIALNRLITSLRTWGYILVPALLAIPLFCQIQNSFEPISGLAFSIPPDRTQAEPSRGIRFIAVEIGYARVIERQSWPLSQVLNALVRMQGNHNTHLDVMIGSDGFHFNTFNLGLAAAQDRLPIDIRTTAYYSDPDRLRKDVQDCSFFLFLDHAEPQSVGYNTLLDVAMMEVNNPARFQAIQSPLAFPDHSTLMIYRNLRPGAD